MRSSNKRCICWARYCWSVSLHRGALNDVTIGGGGFEIVALRGFACWHCSCFYLNPESRGRTSPWNPTPRCTTPSIYLVKSLQLVAQELQDGSADLTTHITLQKAPLGRSKLKPTEPNLGQGKNKRNKRFHMKKSKNSKQRRKTMESKKPKH